MRLNKVLIIGAIALALLAPPAAADWVASLESPQVSAEQGVTGGSLLALSYRSFEEPNGWESWTLHGDNLEVYTWNRESEITVGNPISTTPAYETENSHGKFSGHVSLLSESGGLSIFSEPGDSQIKHKGGANFQPTDRATYSDAGISTSEEGANPRAQTVDVSEATKVEFDSNWGTITLQGDFAIHLMESSWIISDLDGDHEYKSGREEEPYVPGQPQPPTGHVGTTHDRDTYFYVTNGTLTLTSVDQGNLEYFLSEWSADIPEGIELTNTKGTVVQDKVTRQLDNSTIYLPGPVSFMDGAANDDVLTFTAKTPSDTVYVDGVKLDKLTPEEPNPDPSTTTVVRQGPESWLIPSFAAFLVGALLVGIRFQKPFWYVRWQMRRGKHGFVTQNAPRFFSKAKQRKRAVMMHALALLGIGRFEEATEFLFTLIGDDCPDQPTWDYMTSMALAGSGEFQEALHHLDRCLKSAPQYIEDVQANPLLMRLLHDQESPNEDPVSYA